MNKAQLSVEFIILLSVILFIGTAMIAIQVDQAKEYDAYGDIFYSQMVNDKNSVAIQSTYLLGTHSQSTFFFVTEDYTYTNTSYLLSFSYQNVLTQSSVPGVYFQSQNLSNYSLVKKNLSGWSFE